VEISKSLMRDRLPKKSFFSASEIATLLKIDVASVFLWESEFPQIRSIKYENNIRYYDFDTLVLFSSIKHLLLKKPNIPLALKALAENYRTGAQKEVVITPCGSMEEDLISCSNLLIDDENGFDEKAHEIYQEYSRSMDELSIEVKPEHVGEMLNDALMEKERRELESYRRAEFERALHALLERKKSLDELLVALDSSEPDLFLKRLF